MTVMEAHTASGPRRASATRRLGRSQLPLDSALQSLRAPDEARGGSTTSGRVMHSACPPPARAPREPGGAAPTDLARSLPVRLGRVRRPYSFSF